MVDRPKRRKMDNSYNLKIINNLYYIIFKSNNKYNEVEVTKEVFDLMNRFELDDLKELNEFDKHIVINFIDKIIIGDNKEVEVVLKFKNKYSQDIDYLKRHNL